MKKEITKSETAVKKKEQPARLEVTVKKKAGKKDVDIKNPDNISNLVKKSTGCTDSIAGGSIVEKILYANMDCKDSNKKIEGEGNYALAALAELKPQDGLEGMLAAQMITVFNQAMECFRLAILNKREYFEVSLKYQNQGIKLMRAYNQQLEALDKHRRGGEQKMVIEHVTVNKGGQAIVGTVSKGEGGKDEK